MLALPHHAATKLQNQFLIEFTEYILVMAIPVLFFMQEGKHVAFSPHLLFVMDKDVIK